MGFSVTAAHVIFFFASVTAAGFALDTLWDTTGTATEARATWTRLSASAVDTNLTLSVNMCNSNCDPSTVPIVRIDIRNSGTTVVDYRNLTFIIDGRAHPTTNATDFDIISPSSVSGTDLILPGETARIEFKDVPMTADYANDGSNLPLQVVTLDGVIGRR